jgi:hypothetical protein
MLQTPWHPTSAQCHLSRVQAMIHDPTFPGRESNYRQNRAFAKMSDLFYNHGLITKNYAARRLFPRGRTTQ